MLGADRAAVGGDELKHRRVERLARRRRTKDVDVQVAVAKVAEDDELGIRCELRHQQPKTPVKRSELAERNPHVELVGEIADVDGLWKRLAKTEKSSATVGVDRDCRALLHPKLQEQLHQRLGWILHIRALDQQPRGAQLQRQAQRKLVVHEPHARFERSSSISSDASDLPKTLAAATASSIDSSARSATARAFRSATIDHRTCVK